MKVKIDMILEMVANVNTVDDLRKLLVSKGVNIARQTLYNWQHGKTGFNSAKVEEMAEALGLDPKSIIEY